MLSRTHRAAVIFALAFWTVSCAAKKPAPPVTTQPVATSQDLPGVRNFAWVTPFLARGGQPDSVGFLQLKQRGVKTAVDLRGKSHRDELDGTAMKGVQIPTNVAEPDLKQVVEFLRLVRDEQNRPVFVHDEAGGDRVGLYVGAYRIVEQGWSAQDAIAELGRFGFNSYRVQVPDFLRLLDPEAVRRELAAAPTTTRSPTTRKNSR